MLKQIFLITKYVYKKKYHEDCALLAVPIVVLYVYRFDKFFGVFPMVCLLHVRKIGLCFGK